MSVLYDLGRTTRQPEGARLLGFFCPGCKVTHVVATGPGNEGPRWRWNGSMDMPTFTPSVKVTAGEKTDCHCYVFEGRIRYLEDCTHEFAGRTISLKPVPNGR